MRENENSSAAQPSTAAEHLKIEPGEVIVEEVPPEVSMSEDEQEYTLAGFEIIVTLEPPAK